MSNTGTEAKLDLPDFDVPDLPPKPPTSEAYRAWLLEKRLRLLEGGTLEKILADPLRIPVDARFTLGCVGSPSR